MNMAQISFHLQNKPPFLWDPLSFPLQSPRSKFNLLYWLEHLCAFLGSPLGAACPSSSPWYFPFLLPCSGSTLADFHRPKKPQAARKQPFLLSGALRYKVRFGPRNSMIRSANQPESYRNKMCLPTITKGCCGSFHLVE